MTNLSGKRFFSKFSCLKTQGFFKLFGALSLNACVFHVRLLPQVLLLVWFNNKSRVLSIQRAQLIWRLAKASRNCNEMKCRLCRLSLMGRSVASMERILSCTCCPRRSQQMRNLSGRKEASVLIECSKGGPTRSDSKLTFEDLRS